MTSDNDKKAAEDYAFTLGRLNRTPSPFVDFLAGCEYKEQQARAEVIEEVLSFVKENSFIVQGLTKKEVIDLWLLNLFLTKLERGK